MLYPFFSTMFPFYRQPDLTSSSLQSNPSANIRNPNTSPTSPITPSPTSQPPKETTQNLDSLIKQDLYKLDTILRASGIQYIDADLSSHMSALATEKIVNILISLNNRPPQRHGAKPLPPLKTKPTHNWVEQYCNLYNRTRDSLLRVDSLIEYSGQLKVQLNARLAAGAEMSSLEWTKHRAVEEAERRCQQKAEYMGVKVRRYMMKDYVTSWFGSHADIRRFEKELAEYESAVTRLAGAFDRFELGFDGWERVGLGDGDEEWEWDCLTSTELYRGEFGGTDLFFLED